jgi:hypothetical protein
MKEIEVLDEEGWRRVMAGVERRDVREEQKRGIGKYEN